MIEYILMDLYLIEIDSRLYMIIDHVLASYEIKVN